MNAQLKEKIKQDLISMADFSKADLKEVISLTKELKTNSFTKSNILKNKNIALIFAKPSLRTRISFEVGINQLGGNPIIIKMDEIKIGIRENVEDIANVLSRYVDAIVIRTYQQEEIEELGKYSTVPVINGLSNEEHPCQTIADLFTIQETFLNIDNLKLAYFGDGNNITQSLLICAALANVNMSIATPPANKPKQKYIDIAKKINPNIKIELTNDPAQAAKDAHVLYTDVWVSMGQEDSKNKKDLFKPYQINKELLAHANKDVIVLHCLPAHKDEEISSEVFNKYSKVIYRQAENRLHAQKAILLKLISE